MRASSVFVAFFLLVVLRSSLGLSDSNFCDAISGSTEKTVHLAGVGISKQWLPTDIQYYGRPARHFPLGIQIGAIPPIWLLTYWLAFSPRGRTYDGIGFVRVALGWVFGVIGLYLTITLFV